MITSKEGILSICGGIIPPPLRVLTGLKFHRSGCGFSGYPEQFLAVFRQFTRGASVTESIALALPFHPTTPLFTLGHVVKWKDTLGRKEEGDFYGLSRAILNGHQCFAHFCLTSVFLRRSVQTFFPYLYKSPHLGPQKIACFSQIKPKQVSWRKPVLSSKCIYYC